MKTIITSLTILMTTLGYSQVIIGDNTGTATNKTSVLLEFAAQPSGTNTGKGLILPYVTTLPTATGSDLLRGTIVLDATTATAARVKYHNGTNWIDLSGQDADISTIITAQNGLTETTGESIIGATSTPDSNGVLVLESTTKAMVLPIVDNVQNIPSPSPGMMVYVKGVSPDFNKRLAVYNGSKWSFWKP